MRFYVVSFLIVLLYGCGSPRPDYTLIPTEKIEIPPYVREKCVAPPIPERSLSEVEVVEYIGSLFNEIDKCDSNRSIAVETIDGLLLENRK